MKVEKSAPRPNIDSNIYNKEKRPPKPASFNVHSEFGEMKKRVSVAKIVTLL